MQGKREDLTQESAKPSHSLGDGLRKNNPPNASESSGKGGVCDAELVIERNTVVTCKVKLGRSKNSPIVDKVYRVIGVYDKSYNKWFMSGSKKPWSTKMAKKEKKKYKLTVCMIEDSALEDYDDVILTDGHYNRS